VNRSNVTNERTKNAKAVIKLPITWKPTGDSEKPVAMMVSMRASTDASFKKPAMARRARWCRGGEGIAKCKMQSAKCKV
jgi:hypothetical protein